MQDKIERDWQSAVSKARLLCRVDTVINQDHIAILHFDGEQLSSGIMLINPETNKIEIRKLKYDNLTYIHPGSTHNSSEEPFILSEMGRDFSPTHSFGALDTQGNLIIDTFYRLVERVNKYFYFTYGGTALLHAPLFIYQDTECVLRLSYPIVKRLDKYPDIIVILNCELLTNLHTVNAPRNGDSYPLSICVIKQNKLFYRNPREVVDIRLKTESDKADKALKYVRITYANEAEERLTADTFEKLFTEPGFLKKKEFTTVLIGRKQG